MFIKRLWQKWRRCPWQLRWAIVPTLIIVTFYSVENFRGWYSLKKYRDYWEAKGEWFDLSDRPLPPEGPDQFKLLGDPAIKALLDEPNVFSLTSLEKDLALAIISEQKKWANSHLYPFENVMGEPSQRLNRREGALLYLKTIEHWNDQLEGLSSAVNRANLVGREPFESYSDMQFPYLSTFRGAAIVLKYRAQALLATDQADQACDDICTILKLGNLIQNDADSFLIDQLVAIAILEISIEPLWEGMKLKLWDDSHLVKFSNLLDYSSAPEFPHTTYQMERPHAFQAIAQIDSFAERISHDLDAYDYLGITEKLDLPDDMPYESEIEDFISKVVFCIIPDGWIDLWTIQMSENTRRALLNPPDTQPLPFYSKIWKLSSIANLGYDSIRESRGLSITTQGIAAIATANERYYIKHGQYTEQPSQLVPDYLPKFPTDHSSGKPIKYIPPGARSSSPVIYAFGKNKTDENGYPAKRRQQGDTVWQYELPKGYTLEDYRDSNIP